MTKYAWPVAVAIAGVILAIAGCSHSSTPSTAGSAVPSAISPQPTTSPAQAPSVPPASSAAPASSAPALPATSFTVCMAPVIPCAGEMRTEPTSVELSGDGSTFVSGVTWSGWGGSAAQGTGNLMVDNCTPNCAQGKLSSYPATISLSGLTPYADGLQAYADMAVSAPADSYDQSYSNLLPS